MLPRELDDIFEEYTEDDYSLYVTKAEYSGEIFLVDFALDIHDINDKGAVNQKWTVQVGGQRKNHVSFGFAPFIEIKEDHPLLWEFTDVQCQLHYTGQCKEPANLFFDLYATHKRLFGKHQCFNISFGEETASPKPFQYSNGLLTQGSKKLMEIYADCLKQNGLEFYFFGERPAKYWDGEQYILESLDFKILFLGDSYIIAKDFSFAQHGQNTR